MEIKYLGHSSFFIKMDKTRIVTDPFDSKMIGLKYPAVEADIVTVSHQHKDHNQTNLVKGDILVIDMPGEFEKKGIRIFGFPYYHDKKKGAERGENILFKIQGERITVLHCGDLGAVPEDSFIEQIGSVDVILVPVGGNYTIDANEAVDLVKKIEPSIVIPMHFAHEKTIMGKEPHNLLPVSDFLKKMNAQDIVPIPKVVIKKEELSEEMKVMVLEI